MALASALVVSGQFRRVEPPQREPVASPASKPQPRRFVGEHPITILSGLLSSSPERRKQALQQLGVASADATESIQASIRAVNLDSDPELEYVLILVPTFPPASTAYVFDKDERGWWIVGEFSYGWHWDANEAERFLELREIVRRGRKDILVRDMEGGTGLQETDLSIYRIANGALYRIFETVEEREGWVVGTSATEYEHRMIDFPDPDEDGKVFLVSHYEKNTVFSNHERPDRRSTSCAAYRWDAESFVFVVDSTAAKTKCGAR